MGLLSISEVAPLSSHPLCAGCLTFFESQSEFGAAKSEISLIGTHFVRSQILIQSLTLRYQQPWALHPPFNPHQRLLHKTSPANLTRCMIHQETLRQIG